MKIRIEKAATSGWVVYALPDERHLTPVLDRAFATAEELLAWLSGEMHKAEGPLAFVESV